MIKMTWRVKLKLWQKNVKRTAALWILIIPGLIYYAIFHYYPMYGAQMAFRDFSPWLGFSKSPWVGWDNFNRFLTAPDFWNIIRNTLVINIVGLGIGFSCPIILAILINEIRNKRFQKTVQTITYAPYFISTVVLVGMLCTLLSPSSGIFNILIKRMGGSPIHFMGEAGLYVWIYVLSGIWQSCGYSAIIYISALTSIDESLHEAAKVDGAGRLKRILHIDLPGIMPTILTMLILQAGRLLSIGFDKSYLMQNSMNIGVSEVIATYTYKRGIIGGDFGYSASIGMFQSIVSLAILVLVNQISKKVNETSLW